MKLYSALIQKNSNNEVEDIVTLKEGFSFPAFFFSGLWFLYHKMWREFFSLALINIVLGSLSNSLSSFDKTSFQIAFIVIIAMNANYWLGKHLQNNKGYKFAGLVYGSSDIEAKLRFIKNQKVDFSPKILKEKANNSSQLSKKIIKLLRKNKKQVTA